ncbi:hypothetical protein [uncultured Hymenobacter sp.]|uniref:hypothetical protein n=1 Tax=uncultured Hymenobacter sp. TaxID=170016 RepID=UPI0035CADF20
MRNKLARRKNLMPEIEPGSFLEVALAPGYYTYARNLDGLSRFAFYDVLSSESFTDIRLIYNCSLLLTAPLLMPEASKWPIIGHLPLVQDQLSTVYYWRAEPPPFIDEKSQELIFSPDAQYFLVDYTNNTPIYIPASPESLRGLPRQSLYLPEFIEDKLRLHHGITPQGGLRAPVPLKQQPLW